MFTALVAPLPVPMAIAVYFTIWWVSLFVVLPFGVRSQSESGDVSAGTEPGAPVTPGLARKAAWTTLLSAALFAALIAALRIDW